jgi:hypothetical protein
MSTSAWSNDRRELAAIVRDTTIKVLTREVDVSRAQPEVTDVRFLRDISPATGRAVNVISICILCDSRDLVIGRTLEIAPWSRDGHTSDFMAGVIHASLTRAGAGEDFRVALDVEERPANDLADNKPNMYVYRTIAEAQDAGFLSRGSPLMQEIDRYQMQYVLTSGRILCGPSLGLIVETRNHLEHLPDAFVVDLFCGAAGLTRVALQEGAAEVLAVDLAISDEAVAANLGHLAAGARVVEGDSTNVRPEREVDVLVCDPFHETAIAQMQTVRPWVSKSTQRMIVNLGPISHPAWCARVRNLVGSMLPMRYERVHGLEMIGVFG